MTATASARLGRAVLAYAAGIILIGVTIVGLATADVITNGWQVTDPALVVVIAACMLVAELRPVSWLRRSRDHGAVTVSLAFAAALLYLFGGLGSILPIVAVSAVADLVNRRPPLKAAFNAAVVGTTAAVGLGVLSRVGAGALDPAAMRPATVAGIGLACLAMYAVNTTAVNVVIALASGESVAESVVGDFFLYWDSDGVLLPLGPVLALVGLVAPLLLPFAVLATVAVYRSANSAAKGMRDACADPLTGLANRRAFDELAEVALERGQRSGRPPVLLLLDLDDFKPINDLHGHHVGDAVLVEVAQRLRSVAPEGAAVARLGGDEFAVLAGVADDAGPDALIAAVTSIFVDPVQVGARSGELHLPISGSVGVCVPDLASRGVGELVRAADAAMYEAKRRGEPHRIADPALLVTGPLHVDLRNAIGGSDLRVVYQPIIDVRTRGVVGFEALARWTHPQHGAMPPSQFIAMAESSGLIGLLTRRVVDDALATLADLHARGHPTVGMAVNASVQDVADPTFPAHLVATAARYGLPTSSITVEVTETAMATDALAAAAGLRELLAAGVRVALDDFGAGWSSLSALVDLPLTGLKIDRRFVESTAAPAGCAVVRAVTDLASALGLEVTAEGVADDDTLDVLADVGCTAAQGFGIAVPMQALDAMAWLAGREPAVGAGSAGPELDGVPLGPGALAQTEGP